MWLSEKDNCLKVGTQSTWLCHYILVFRGYGLKNIQHRASRIQFYVNEYIY